MERASERRAFARAWSYLNYNAAAKWTALVAAVAAGVLYVLLLLILWLFGDLMVHRGQIPAFDQLTTQEQKNFDQQWLAPANEQETEGSKALELLGLQQTRSADKGLGTTKPTDDRLLTPEEQRFLWRVYLVQLLHDRVSGTAGMLVLPAFRDLPETERQAVLTRWQSKAIGKREEALKGFEDRARIDNILRGQVTNADDQEVLWRAYLLIVFDEWIEEYPNTRAYQEARARLNDWLYAAMQGQQETTEENPLADRGILSLVARVHLHDRYYKSLVDVLARANSPMWKWRSTPPWGNSVWYLGECAVLAIVLAFFWAAAMYLMREMAARAVIEATTRLRRAVYHHTFRLGTLAFRALGPSEAVTVFTRHVEAVHDGLYTWITVTFREPVKFGLLLAFALIVNWKLALAFLFFAALVWMIGGQIVVHSRREGRAATNQAS